MPDQGRSGFDSFAVARNPSSSLQGTQGTDTKTDMVSLVDWELAHKVRQSTGYTVLVRVRVILP